jgi:predicted RNA binding protein YcfA (HicA-like mRNA interferase family)
MPNGVFNWTFRDVVKVLKAHGFGFVGSEGSHHHYVGEAGGAKRLVQVAFHGQSTIKPRTFKSIVAQSGIPLKEWHG